MNPYFVAPNGQQQGPFTFAQLQAMLNAGQLNVTDLCWREGMPDWQAISSAIPSLLGRPSTSPHLAPSAVELNPYLPPRAAPSSYGGSAGQKRVGGYGGLGRAAYFGSVVLFQIIGFLIAGVMGESKIFDKYRMVEWVFIAVYVGLGIFLLSMRLKNTGSNRWLLLLLLVPGINMLFAFALGLYILIAPEGYADTRTLDGPGKVMAWIIGLFFGGLLLLGLFSRATPFIFR